MVVSEVDIFDLDGNAIMTAHARKNTELEINEGFVDVSYNVSDGTKKHVSIPSSNISKVVYFK